jgi:hypothetical protein
MSKIRFQAKLAAIGSQTILRLPDAGSSKLPSRWMSMVEGTLNGHVFQTRWSLGSHWFRVSEHQSFCGAGSFARCGCDEWAIDAEHRLRQLPPES